MRVGIIGGGRAAWTFAHLVHRRGWHIEGVALRPGSESRIASLVGAPRIPARELAEHCDLVLIAVPDGAIATIAAEIEPHDHLTLFHASGCLASDVLPTRRRFSLHPLRSLGEVGSDLDVNDTLFVFEGADECENLARDLVSAGGGEFVRIAPQAKALYHAAAVFASNYVAAVCGVAERLFGAAGIHSAAERNAIAALARSAIANWQSGAGDARYTGPVVRGDVECIAAHEVALAALPQLRLLYAELGTALTEDLASNVQREEIKALFTRMSAASIP